MELIRLMVDGQEHNMMFSAQKEKVKAAKTTRRVAKAVGEDGVVTRTVRHTVRNEQSTSDMLAAIGLSL